jgi:hypothetical protein
MLTSFFALTDELIVQQLIRECKKKDVELGMAKRTAFWGILGLLFASNG